MEMKTFFDFYSFNARCSPFTVHAKLFSVFYSICIVHMLFINCTMFESRLNTCGGSSNPRIHGRFYLKWCSACETWCKKATMNETACRFYPQFNSSNYFTVVYMFSIHCIKFSIHKSALFEMAFVFTACIDGSDFILYFINKIYTHFFITETKWDQLKIVASYYLGFKLII